MIDRKRIRHLFVPAIQFLVNVSPQGEGKPSYLEKAAIFLIEGRDRDGSPMSVDEFIFQMGLGEPAGRELVDGMWRKGWLIVQGNTATLHLSLPVKAELEEKGVNAEFNNFGTGEAPWSVPCYLDLISGQAFVPPRDRLDKIGRPPYIIEAFNPDSKNAPWGVSLERFMDFKEQDLLRALKAYEEFRRAQSVSASLTAKIHPPEVLPTLRDILTVRVFFSVSRDSNDTLSLVGSESRNAQMSRLAEGIEPVIAEGVLNLDTPLRNLFLAEIPTNEEPGKKNEHTLSGHIRKTIEQFGLVETAKPENTADAFQTAQALAARSLELVRDLIGRTSARQVEVQFFSGRKDAENSARNLIESFTDQAIVISPRATANNVIRFVDHAEKHSDWKAKRLLLIQPGARLNSHEIQVLRTSISQKRHAKRGEAQTHTRVIARYFDSKDVFVDTPVVIADGTDVLLTSRGLMESPDNPLTGFRFTTLAPPQGDRGKGLHLTNVTNELVEAIYPTSYDPSLRLNFKARRPSQLSASANAARKLFVLTKELEESAAADQESAYLNQDGGGVGLDRDDTDADTTSQKLNTASFREIARLRARELEMISEVVREFETSAPVVAEGVHGMAILETSLAMLKASKPHLPFFVGVNPTEPPAPEFTEVIEELFLRYSFKEGTIVFLGEPHEEWKRLAARWQSPKFAGLTVNLASGSEDMRHRATFLPFVISSAGCVLASSGISTRILVAPRRSDKITLGVILKGADAQDKPLQMLSLLLRHKPDVHVPELSDFAVEDSLNTPNFLSSTLYRRWLMRTAPSQVQHADEGVSINLGVSVLIEPFKTDVLTYERCRDDSAEIKNPEYQRAVEKAAVITGLVSRNAYAMELWEKGSIFEAALMAEALTSDHMLASRIIRDLIRDLTLPTELAAVPIIDKRMLANEQLLALVAINLLHPKRRKLLVGIETTSLPTTKLGIFVATLMDFARASDEETLSWAQSRKDKLAYSTQEYGVMFRDRLESFQRDRNNTEARAIQALLREDFGPLKQARMWVNENRDPVPRDTEEARRILLAEFGKDFYQKLKAKGNRENICRGIVEQKDRESRQQRANLQEFVGGLKKGMITSISRFLETMLSLAVFAESDDADSLSEEREATRKAAERWLNTGSSTADETTPLGLLLDIAHTSGHIAPNGEVNHWLWRFPRLLEKIDSRNASADSAAWTRELAEAILEEEWLPSAGLPQVFAYLCDAKRFQAAEWVLDLEEQQVSEAEFAEQARDNAARRDKLEALLFDAASHLVGWARSLEREAALFDIPALRGKAQDWGELLSSLEVTSGDIDFCYGELREIAGEIAALVPQRLATVAAKAPTEITAFSETLIRALGNVPPSRILALSHFSTQTVPIEVKPLEGTGTIGLVTSRIRDFDTSDGYDPLMALARFKLKRSPMNMSLLQAAEVGLTDVPHASDDELRSYLEVIDSVFAMTDGPTVRRDFIELGDDDELSFSRPVDMAEGALARWLNRQVPSYQIRVFTSAINMNLDLEETGLCDGPLPVFINPFQRTPRIDRPHLMIRLDQVLASFAMKNPDEALKNSIVQNAALTTFLPWEDRCFEDRAEGLARLLGIQKAEAMAMLPSDRLARLIRQLMGRLHMNWSWSSRRLFDDASFARKAANHCLTFMAAGSLVDAYDIIWATRQRSQGATGILCADLFLHGLQVENEIKERARNAFERGLSQEAAPMRARTFFEALVAVWVMPETTSSRTELADFLFRRLQCESEREAIETFCDWLVEAQIIIEEGGQPLQINRAHPFSSIAL